MNAALRLLASAVIAFSFYALWAYYANSLVTTDTEILYKAALVQGAYSGLITLFFTFLIEFFNKLFSNKVYCLPFVVPTLIKPKLFTKKCVTTITFEQNLRRIELACNGTCVPGMLITPIPALALQTLLVIAVNLAFETPNLWLTVAPSILFSGVYGYIYSVSLTKKLHRNKK